MIDIFDTSTVGQLVTATDGSDPNSPRLLTYGDHVLSLAGNPTDGYVSAPFTITSSYNPSGGEETSTAVVNVVYNSGAGIWYAYITFTDSFGLWTGTGFSCSNGDVVTGFYGGLFDVFPCLTGSSSSSSSSSS